MIKLKTDADNCKYVEWYDPINKRTVQRHLRDFASAGDIDSPPIRIIDNLKINLAEREVCVVFGYNLNFEDVTWHNYMSYNDYDLFMTILLDYEEGKLHEMRARLGSDVDEENKTDEVSKESDTANFYYDLAKKFSRMADDFSELTNLIIAKMIK